MTGSEKKSMWQLPAHASRWMAVLYFLSILSDIAPAQQPGQQTPPSIYQLDESLLDATTRDWLSEFRKRGTGSSPEAQRWRDNETAFKTVLHHTLNKPSGSKSFVVVGQISVSNPKPVDPRAIASPCAILEGGFFATRVEEETATLPFRLQGYEPLDLPLKPGAADVVNVGQITLKPLPRKELVTASGQIVLEEDPAVPRPRQVQIEWHIMAGRLTNEVMNFEYEPTPPQGMLTPEMRTDLARWAESTRRVMHFEYDREQHLPSPVVTRVARDGRIRTTGLVPAFYQVVVSAPGYITTAYYVDLSDKAGKTADLSPMPLLVAKRFTNSIGMEFVRIPPGEFPANPYYDGENAPALMSVPNEFYISRYELSRGEYEKLTGTLAKDFGIPKDKETNSYPLRLLSGSGVMKLEPAFRICRLLSELPTEQMAGRTYRLPEEHEWVHACRGGTRTRFPVKQEELEEYLWNATSKNALTQPKPLATLGKGVSRVYVPLFLGGFSYYMSGAMYVSLADNLRPAGEGRPNPWGLYNIQGNVREVCVRWLSSEEASQWTPASKDSRHVESDLDDGWRLQVLPWSATGKNASYLYKSPAAPDDFLRVGEILVRGGGYGSGDQECLRGRRLAGLDDGIGLRLVCTIDK